MSAPTPSSGGDDTVPFSNTYTTYTTNGVQLILHVELDSTDTLNLAKLAAPSDVSTCLVVAENSTFTPIDNSDAGLPSAWSGKTLSILSNTLLVNEGISTATIDVSGKDGVVNETSGTATSGDAGGSIYLYVEELPRDSLEKLRLKAGGGNGSRYPGSNDDHGQGGSGGKGGNITFYYRDPARPVYKTISGLRLKPWMDQITDVDKIISACGPISTLGYTFDITVRDALQASQKEYAAWVLSLAQLFRQLDAALGNDLYNQPLIPLSDASQAIVNQAVEAISRLKLCKVPPTSPTAGANALSSLSTDLAQFMLGGTAEDQLLESLKAFRSYLDPDTGGLEETALGVALRGLDDELQASVSMYIQYQINASLLNVDGGKGGPGGHGGTNGTDGESGTIVIQEMFGDDDPRDLTANQILAFPDQCRMVLNAANAYFYASNPQDDTNKDSRVAAGIFYTRLVRRLDFVVPLYGKPSADPPAITESETEPPALLVAFRGIEGQLTLAVQETLVNIHNTAKTSLNLLLGGRDMFGHLPNWVPRLSAASYAIDAQKSFERLDDIQRTWNEYAQNYQQTATRSSQLAGWISSADARILSAVKQQSLLAGPPGGFLEDLMEQIENFTPVITKQRNDLISQLAVVKHVVESSFSIDIGSLLGALANVAMAPSRGFAIATTINELYKSMDTITDDQGNKINRDYIISKLTTYTGKLQGLAEGYSRQSNGEISPDDPGAAKVLATVDDIESWVTEFANSIPAPNRTALQASIDTYVTTIKLRNTAVLSYNACVEQYISSCNDENYYTGVRNKAMANLTKIDPALPAIYHWLSKQLDDAVLDTMRYLNYQARAIRLWGLVNQTSFAAQPLLIQETLISSQTSLETAFNNALETYAEHTWSQWPPNFDTTGGTGDNTQSSVYYHMKEKDHPLAFETFKRGTLDDYKSKVYGLAMTFDVNKPPPGLLAGKANIRLYQVRVWLLGAKVPDETESKFITLTMTHAGKETFHGTDRNAVYEFEHDLVEIPFSFDTSKVKSWSDCVTANAGSSEDLTKTYSGQQGATATIDSYAAVGPFTTWTLEVKESDNPGGVDVQGVTDIYVEFWGRSQATD